MNDSLRAIAHQSLAMAAPPYLRYQKRGRHCLRDGVALIASDFEGPGFNFAAVLVRQQPLGRVMELAGEFFSTDCRWGILVEGDAGTRIEAELLGAGWTPAEDEPAMVIEDLAAACAGWTSAQWAGHLDIRRVSDAAGVGDYGRVVCEAFNAPPEMAEAATPPQFARDPQLGLFVGYLEGRPVSTAMFSLVDRTVSIAGVATLEAFRGRCYGGWMTQAALLSGLAAGCVSASLRTGPLSRPLYERMGFVFACWHRTYISGESASQ